MVRLRIAALLGLLALVPIGLFFAGHLGQGVAPLALTGVSVLLIVGSLWVMFGDAEPAGGAHPEP